MRSLPLALVVLVAGGLTFGAVFAVLQATRSDATPAALDVPATAVPTPIEVQVVPRATDSVARQLDPQAVAMGVPSVDSEPLLQGLRPGDRLDVLASLPSPEDGRPVTAVVVRGATVLRPASATDPLLLEISSPDALVLAHLVLGETRLAFVVWSNAGSPPSQQPLDERTARALLGLPSLTVPTVVATPSPTGVPQLASATPTPTGTAVVEDYTVQAGDSLDSIASSLGIDTGALWWANRLDVDPVTPLVAGTRLRVPLAPGFLYQVQPGDTWSSIAATFRLSPITLRESNGVSADDSLSPASLVLIPRRR